MTEINGASIARLPTQVPGLDVVLKGGLLRGGVYLLMGSPGSGKTILSNQICFRHASAGGCALYVTLLAESHSRMIAHIEGMDFFDPEAVSRSVFFHSGYQQLESQGLEGLLEMLRAEIRARHASVLVLDGLVTAGAVAESELALKKFIHELKAFVELVGCTCLVLTSVHAGTSHYPARTMVDGLIEMRLTSLGMMTARELEVVKLRGGDQLMGQHFFDISDAGVKVYPRLEAVSGRSAAPDEPRERLRLGSAELDEMMGGGILSGSVTVLLGPPGSGKTLLGLQFLDAGADRGEPGLYFGFYENPPRLIGKAEGVGLRLGAHARDGTIAIHWTPPLEQHADALAGEVLAQVARRGVRRLVFDGLGGLAQAMLYSDRLPRLFTALSNELRALGVTTLVTEETGATMVDSPDLPFGRLSAAVENIVLLRYVERSARLYRLISLLKVREGTYDPSLREFIIDSNGFRVAPDRESAEAILADRVPRLAPPDANEDPRRRS